MIDPRFSYRPEYTGSRALVIGINSYQHVSPLFYAVNDAEAVADSLKSNFDFSEANVVTLLEEGATKQQILRCFCSFAADDIGPNERILIFFAGHGYTRSGSRREAGFLVPHDGNPQDLSTLIRWDELTRGAELIPAKHVLFIMDACYGGLAITRSPSPGSVRYLKDMLNRYSRQVLTAGKADEAVADAGGPIAGHSVFTGHLLEALAGKAADKDGILTANGLMAYVAQTVAKDGNSQQSPHYGFVEGDGDFIFKAPVLESLEEDDRMDIDALITLPAANVIPAGDAVQEKIVNAKRLLSDDAAVIELHDFAVQEIRQFLAATGEDHFKIDGVTFSQDEFLERLSKYEAHSEALAGIAACIAYWAKPPHHQILRKMFARITDRLESRNGLVAWSYLRWYPVILQFYTAGIAAVEGKRYDSLAAIFYIHIDHPIHYDKQSIFVEAVGEAILEYNRMDLFKRLPGHERNYTPLSEYLHKLLQPDLDDILFVGKSYETAFDEFEVLFALAVACIRKQNERNIWGPVGRFGWKYGSRGSTNPLTAVITAAKKEGEHWPLLKAGLFGGNYDAFIEAAGEYEQMIAGLHYG
ncbi:MAG: caspase family protein [Caldilineaceae bacterium]